MATLTFDSSKPPISLLAVIERVSLSGSPLAISLNGVSGHGPEPVLISGDGVTFKGSGLIIRYLARLAPPALKLYNLDASETTQIDFFIEFSKQVSNKDVLTSTASLLESHLANRMTLVDNRITIADLLIFEQLELNIRWVPFQKSDEAKFPHLFRWYNFVMNDPAYKSPLSALRAQAEAKKQAFYDASKSGSFALAGGTGLLPDQKMITRFPPEPSGYLHVGHAKAALLNYHYAKEYNGELIVRFDDTNPSKEKDEYVNSILNDLKTLNIVYSKLTYTSDYFDLLLQLCQKLITEGNAYVDDTPVEQMRKERMDGIPSKRRNNTVEENLALWEEMKNGTENGLKCVVRAKIDMDAKNKTLRDPTLYRCNVKVPHHRTGTKYKVYPTYDFCCPIVDSIENVSHVLRTIEYRDRNEQYEWIIKALKLRMPLIRDYSRLNFVYTLMSKRKLQWFVDSKLVEGWHDPRFPTIQGIMRRGMTVEAITEFMNSQGFSLNGNYMEWDKIWTMNKKVIDPIAPRYTAISVEDKVPVTLTNVSGLSYHTVALHPKEQNVGTKVIAHSNVIFLEQHDATQITPGEEITLISWGNAFIDKIEKDSNGKVISAVGRIHPEGDFKKTNLKLTWIAGQEQNLVYLNLVEFDHLITVSKLEDDMEVQDYIRPQSKFTTLALGEQALRKVQRNDIIQLNRRGFFRVDDIGSPSNGGSVSSPLTLFLIPDGRQKSMSTLPTKVDKSASAAKK